MKIDPNTRSGRLLMALAGHLARAILLLLGATWRWRLVAGEAVLADLHADPRPMILCFWHNRAFMGAHFLYRQLHRRGHQLTLMASQSRDGELVSRVVEGLGVHTARGSATRGGRKAIWSVYRAIKRRRSSPVVAPDGPHGPIYEFKVGVAILAQLSSEAILPMGFAAERCWRIRSWDRLIVPKPFSRVAAVLGEPRGVPQGLSEQDLEAERSRLQSLLEEATRRAEDAVGVRAGEEGGGV